MIEDYYIYTDDGDKFCRRYLDEKGMVNLQTPSGTITLMRLQTLALNPKEANKNRGKHKFSHRFMYHNSKNEMDDPSGFVK